MDTDREQECREDPEVKGRGCVCPKCQGAGCDICDYEGVIKFTLLRFYDEQDKDRMV